MADLAESTEIEVTETMIDAGMKAFSRDTWSETLGDYAGQSLHTARRTVEEIIKDALATRSQKTK